MLGDADVDKAEDLRVLCDALAISDERLLPARGVRAEENGADARHTVRRVSAVGESRTLG